MGETGPPTGAERERRRKRMADIHQRIMKREEEQGNIGMLRSSNGWGLYSPPPPAGLSLSSQRDTVLNEDYSNTSSTGATHKLSTVGSVNTAVLKQWGINSGKRTSIDIPCSRCSIAVTF